MAGGAGSALGRGGMLTKVLAAKRAARSGAHTVIASGREPDVLLRLAAASAIGTLLGAHDRRSRRASSGWPTTCSCAARSSSTPARRPAARRAARACCRSACTEVEGEFARGDVIAVRALRRRGDRARPGELPAAEARLHRAQASREIEAVLGYVDEPELIHRDNLVLA